jgi:hypothetical protein
MNQEEYQSAINEEVKGSEAAVRKMLLYYVSALQSTGVEDVRQYIATRIGEMISLSEEQVQFILANFNKENQLIENLDNSVRLLEKMKKEEKLDMESLDIVIKVLSLIRKDYDEFSLR